MSKIIDAVSIVLTCGDEIFAIQRQRFLKAFPGYWAFPGGKVELGDESLSIQHPSVEGIDARLLGAAFREGKEELGIDLGEEIKNGRIQKVDFLGLAITPDFNPYRFATYFFRFNFKEKVHFTVDYNEAFFAEWISCKDLLDKYNNGEVLAVPPVIKVIETLGQNIQTSHINDLNFTYDSDNFVPYIESIKGLRQIMPLSNTLPPATRTNAFLIGDSTKVLLDPSPKDESEYQKFKNTLSLFGVDKIMLTHHHPDHHQYSVELAQELNLPILIGQDSFTRLNKLNQDYFKNVQIQFLKEGDVVTSWLGRKVVVYEVPGHDEGHLALAAEDMSWFIAGDLFQGVGTVVVGGDEGDMKKYCETLQKVIALAPKVIYPSHGIGLGGVVILEKTLEHRKVRENQILTLHQEGKSEQEILELIYRDVDKKLWPYALENIKKHMEKLRAEGFIK
ncbi:MAG: MBL fold metallo-hydrolase [Bacteriovoracaceae bacterium]